MAEFKFVPEATFKIDVEIPQLGKDPGVLTVTFRHKKASEIQALLDDKILSNGEFVFDIMAGWAFPEEFNKENLNEFLENYPSATLALTRAFINEVGGVREKK